MKTRNRFSTGIGLVTTLVVVTALSWLPTATARAVADQSTGSALRFDGIDDYVDLERGPSFAAHTLINDETMSTEEVRVSVRGDLDSPATGQRHG